MPSPNAIVTMDQKMIDGMVVQNPYEMGYTRDASCCTG